MNTIDTVFFYIDNDPQVDSVAQRAWLGFKDPGMYAIEKKAVPKGLPAVDNQTSLAFGEGAWKDHPKEFEPGAYRKIRTEITMVPNWKCTSKVV